MQVGKRVKNPAENCTSIPSENGDLGCVLKVPSLKLTPKKVCVGKRASLGGTRVLKRDEVNFNTIDIIEHKKKEQHSFRGTTNQPTRETLQLLQDK